MMASGGTTKRHDDGNAWHDDGDPRLWDEGAIVVRRGRSTLLIGVTGGGIADAMTTTTMGGPGDINVEVVNRFARAGRL